MRRHLPEEWEATFPHREPQELLEELAALREDKARLDFLAKAAKEVGWWGWSCEEDGMVQPANLPATIREAIDETREKWEAWYKEAKAKEKAACYAE